MSFFDPTEFRAMLESPTARARFASAYPSARGLFQAYLEAAPRNLPQFPTDGLTALQFTVFDNGEQPRERSNLTRATKSRFGLNLKAWDRLTIDWRRADQVAWEGNSALHRQDGVLTIARRLRAKGLLSPGVDDALSELVTMAEGEGLYGFFHQRKPGLGSRWSEVVAHVRWAGDVPSAAFLVLPDLSGYEAHGFERTTATGLPLGGRAIAQARTAFDERFARWATELSI